MVSYPPLEGASALRRVGATRLPIASMGFISYARANISPRARLEYYRGYYAADVLGPNARRTSGAATGGAAQLTTTMIERRGGHPAALKLPQPPRPSHRGVAHAPNHPLVA